MADDDLSGGGKRGSRCPIDGNEHEWKWESRGGPTDSDGEYTGSVGFRVCTKCHESRLTLTGDI